MTANEHAPPHSIPGGRCGNREPDDRGVSRQRSSRPRGSSPAAAPRAQRDTVNFVNFARRSAAAAPRAA